MAAGAEGAVESAQLIEYKNQLAPFSETNSYSKLIEFTDPNGQQAFLIERPWDDSSLGLLIPDEDPASFIKILNDVILPERFAAVWHKDTKDLEVIWTALKLPSLSEEVQNRKFSFKFRGNEYACEFGEASERTLALAKHHVPLSPSTTDHRNLRSFKWFADVDLDAEMRGFLDKPRSFWVRNVNWDEDEVLSLILHLNFHLQYFDALSPIVIVHPPSRTSSAKPPTRYPFGSFPEKISSREIDTNLLFIWEAARIGDNARRFLYYYRVIEYASMFYLENSARTSLRIALAAPNALDDLSALTDTVLAAVQKTKLDEYARYESLIREAVQPKLLWQEIGVNMDAFTKGTEFEGGFKLSPLWTPDRSESNFTQEDVVTFARKIREIRNALSHGKDQKTATMIAPTAHNFTKLQPWIGPISMAAGQVIVYKDVF